MQFWVSVRRTHPCEMHHVVYYVGIESNSDDDSDDRDDRYDHELGGAIGR